MRVSGAFQFNFAPVFAGFQSLQVIADHRHGRVLRARCKRPNGGTPTEEHEKSPPSHVPP
jgi:hypothetical protein